MAPTIIVLGCALLALLILLWRYSDRLLRLEKDRLTQQEREMMIDRIRYLEDEVKRIKGSVPYKLFSHAKTA